MDKSTKSTNRTSVRINCPTACEDVSMDEDDSFLTLSVSYSKGCLEDSRTGCILQYSNANSASYDFYFNLCVPSTSLQSCTCKENSQVDHLEIEFVML